VTPLDLRGTLGFDEAAFVALVADARDEERVLDVILRDDAALFATADGARQQA
jgi:hypothetical protein